MTGTHRRRRAVQERTYTPRVSERAFQSQVEQYARMMGWLVSHAFLSIKSVAGFPDLLCLRGGAGVRLATYGSGLGRDREGIAMRGGGRGRQTDADPAASVALSALRPGVGADRERHPA